MATKTNPEPDRLPILLSHGPGCFDGTTCAVAVARYYGTRTIIPQFTHPSQLDSVIETMIATTPDPHDLWITDMAWKHRATDKHLRQLIENGWRVFWIDHHRNAIEKPKSEIRDIHLTGYVISSTYAASRLLFDFLLDQPPTSPDAAAWLSSLQNIVMLADEHDRWLHNGQNEKSMRLALAIEQLARQGNGLDGYQTLLDIDADATFTPTLTRAYDEAKTELQASLSLAMSSKQQHVMEALDLTIIYARCNKYASQVGNALRASIHNSIVVLFSESDGRYSLRKSNACEINLASIATFLGGGGHPNAAGFQLASPVYDPTDFIPKIEKAIKAWHTTHKSGREATV
tara:strand:- start:5200 stop:6234 length:1035 start_codon:yes stop_codon:yes gene_type:complete